MFYVSSFLLYWLRRSAQSQQNSALLLLPFSFQYIFAFPKPITHSDSFCLKHVNTIGVYRRQSYSVCVPASRFINTGKCFFISYHRYFPPHSFNYIFPVQWSTISSTDIYVDRLSSEPCIHQIFLDTLGCQFSTILTFSLSPKVPNTNSAVWKIGSDSSTGSNHHHNLSTA